MHISDNKILIPGGANGAAIQDHFNRLNPSSLPIEKSVFSNETAYLF
ncbi:hypothetical protein RYH73_25440 [Olivibacter sp. CPCC 100613]